MFFFSKVKNPLTLSSVDSNIESDFPDLTNDDRLSKKFLDLQKDMKINCVEDFSLPESQIISFSSKNGYLKNFLVYFYWNYLQGTMF